MNAAVFLDRDNTIIHNDGDLGDPNEVQLIQGAASAIASLRGLGYLIVIITNQGGVARGKYGVEDVDKVHEKISELVHANAGGKIDRFYFCPYHPKGTVEHYTREHPWRKPQPGMLLQAVKDLDIDMEQSWMIGDAMRDIEAGQAAGVRSILIKPDAQTLPPLKANEHHAGDDQVRPDFVASTIIEATRVIAQQRRPDRLAQEWENTREIVNQNVQAANVGKDISASAASESTKPFRPWNAPSAEQVSVEPNEQGDLEPQPVKPIEPKPETEQAKPKSKADVLVEEKDDSQPAFKPTLPSDESELEEPVVRLPDVPRPQTVSSGSDDEDVALRFDGGATRLLRLIHQELKNQQSHKGDFSWLRMFAAMMQIIAIVCMFASLWLGAGDKTINTFLYMMGVAIFTQLATLAMLMFDRK